MWLQPWTMEEATVLWSTNQGGLLGIKVKLMLDWDSIRKLGPMTPLPDVVVNFAALLLEAPLTAVDYPEMISVV
ncbi:hypothetical protein Bca4012_075650 [Brassica carinata]|uniref:Uncharacterized protein n=1 Tax=Brassica carinata TaxID=52824 RepID=A0A8X7QB06_BRACI|nr:hypothetical protein Bca52824_073949 [Brassica carinata]